MNDVVNRIPNEITAITGFTNSTYALTDDAYDYALAGIPFLSTVQGGDYIHKRAYTEVMAPIRKQQFDSFAEPGEQSLEGWWLRSQSDFTGGAGILYQDPDNDNQFEVRFSDSLGVNCWTSGERNVVLAVQLVESSTDTRTRRRDGLRLRTDPQLSISPVAPARSPRSTRSPQPQTTPGSRSCHGPGLRLPCRPARSSTVSTPTYRASSASPPTRDSESVRSTVVGTSPTVRCCSLRPVAVTASPAKTRSCGWARPTLTTGIPDSSGSTSA